MTVTSKELSHEEKEVIHRLVKKLGPDGVDQLADIVEQQRRWRWAATTLRNIAAWVAVILSGAVAVWAAFKFLVNAAK